MLLDYSIYWSVGNSVAGLHLKILDRQSHYALDRVQVSDTWCSVPLTTRLRRETMAAAKVLKRGARSRIYSGELGLSGAERTTLQHDGIV